MKKGIVFAIILAFCITGCGGKNETENFREKDEIINEDIIYDAIEGVENNEKVVDDNEEAIYANESIVPEYYAIYAELLRQFMNGENAYFMNGDMPVSYVEQDGASCSQIFSFGLYDLNKDGTEELIVASGNNFINGDVANILIANSKWEDANIGEVSYIDANNGKVAKVTCQLGEDITYYDFAGNELIEYDSYRFSMYYAGDNCLVQDNTYYHGKDTNEEISEEEYNNQDAFKWDSLNIPFYPLSEVNIDFVLNGKLVDDENAEWKQAYSPIVKQWDILHSNDNSYGYELVYIDDNNIPELILACDDEAWTGYDVYTCIDGMAMKLRYEDERNEQQVSNLVSHGCQGKGDAYVEKTGIYMQSSWMMGSYGLNGYVLESNLLKNAFNYLYYDNSWDETITDPYGYQIEYIDSTGSRVTKEVATDGNEKYSEIAGVPEATQIERIYNCDFEKCKSINGSMNYKTISSMLEIDNESINLSDNEKYAKLLSKFIKDGDCCLWKNLDSDSYHEGLKFALKDINCDGRDELMINDNLFIPGDEWDESQLGIVHFYDESSGLYARIDGDMGGCITYYELIGDEEKPVDVYSWVIYDTEECGDTFYYHGVAPEMGGNGTRITEGEYNSQPCYRWTRGEEFIMNAEYHEINYENIHEFLLAE